MRGYSIPRLERGRRWIKRFKFKQIPISQPHWKERLRKWHILDEIAADNHAIDAGYGKLLLRYYQNYLFLYNFLISENFEKLKKENYEIMQIQVTNLEQRLKEENSKKETLIRELIIQGILSIQSGDNPRIVEQKLNSFIAPGDRMMSGE